MKTYINPRMFGLTPIAHTSSSNQHLRNQGRVFINPNFKPKPAIKPNIIHVNPKLISQIKKEKESQKVHAPPKYAPKDIQTVSRFKMIKSNLRSIHTNRPIGNTSYKSKYTKINNTKTDGSKNTQKLVIGKHKLVKVRKLSFHKMKEELKGKYNQKLVEKRHKILKYGLLSRYKWARTSEYKIDNRQRRLLSYFSKKTWCSIWRVPLKKNKIVESKPKIVKHRHAGENRSLVVIGGIQYKNTNTTLQRTTQGSVASSVQNTVANKRKSLKIINIHGQKFTMTRKGTILRKINQQGIHTSSRRRIDIGGVTYREKSDNVFIKTNAHHVRYSLNVAKQRSISHLIHQTKKNNIPCLIFNKFGKCSKMDANKCLYVHLKKNISLCKKFLNGKCVDSKCLLSHDLVQEKMATCHFFLEGLCSRDNCPYLHVKVNSKAVICRNFINGYCHDGCNCKKRHINICPEYEEKKICSKGRKCPYPHRTIIKKVKKIEKTEYKDAAAGATSLTSCKRYYEEKNTTIETSTLLVEKQKLHRLPSYIALTSNDS